MSQAEELLNSLSEEDVMPLLSNPDTEPHIVIGDDRVIVVPDILKRLAVQYDHNIETVTFDCPRYWDEHDMSQMGIYINYRRKDRALGSYRAENIVVDETDPNIMHFDWTISRNVSLVVGKLQFLVCVKKMNDEGEEENHWNSELNEDCYVSEGLETGETILEPYPDLVSQWAEDVEEVKNILLAAKEAGEFDGFSPVVTLTETDRGYDMEVTDVNGTQTYEVRHGSAATITAIELEDGSGYRVVFTDSVDGAQTIELKHGSAATATAVELEDGSGYRLVLTDSVDGAQIIELKHGSAATATAVELEDGSGYRLVLTDAMDGAQIIELKHGSSATATAIDIEGGHRLVLTDAMDGQQVIDIMDGVDGFSPNVTVVNIDDGHRLVITDESGANTIDIMDGISPTITVSDTEETRTVEITDVNGTSSYELLNGEDGVSPVVSTEAIAGGHRVTITDVNGTQTFDVLDGGSDSIEEYVNNSIATDEEIAEMLTEAFSEVKINNT